MPGLHTELLQRFNPVLVTWPDHAGSGPPLAEGEPDEEVISDYRPRTAGLVIDNTYSVRHGAKALSRIMIRIGAARAGAEPGIGAPWRLLMRLYGHISWLHTSPGTTL